MGSETEPPNNQINWKGEEQLLPWVTDISAGQSPKQGLIRVKPCGLKKRRHRETIGLETACARRARQHWGRDGEGFPVRHVLIVLCKEIAGTFSKRLFMNGSVFLLHVPTSRCQQPASAAVPPLVTAGTQHVPAPVPSPLLTPHNRPHCTSASWARGTPQLERQSGIFSCCFVF